MCEQNTGYSTDSSVYVKCYDFLYCTKSLGDKYEKKMIDTRTKLLLLKQQL